MRKIRFEGETNSEGEAEASVDDPKVGLSNDQYLYGIVLSESEAPIGVEGVQGNPVSTIPFGPVAALVGDLESTDELGTSEDLRTHTFVLDSMSQSGPVLPAGFGTVISGDAAICTDVLEPRQDEYYEALRQLSGHGQYTLLVRYERDAVLQGILADNPDAVWLREAIVGTSEDETRTQRAQLDDIVVTTMESSKPAEAGPILDQLGSVSTRMCLREIREADDVVEVALLVRHDAVTRCNSLIGKLAEQSPDRLRFRLVGPEAPYDFVDRHGIGS